MLLTQLLFISLSGLTLSAQVTDNTSLTPYNSTEQLVPLQSSPIRNAVAQGNDAWTSTNWSGYAVTGSDFTSALASWVVPGVNCSGVAENQFSTLWVGMDGLRSGTVEQIGTGSACFFTTPFYYAWYEFFPNTSVNIAGIGVSPGNFISASVQYANGQFTVMLNNKTTGQSFSKTMAFPAATRNSVEWIMEAPQLSSGALPLPNFGTTILGSDYTRIPEIGTGTGSATNSIHTGTIGSFGSTNVLQITKITSPSSPQTSACSLLSNDGTSFSCTFGE